MKKLLVFLTILGVLFVSGLLSFVSAVTQDVSTTIVADLNLSVTPNPLDFGSILPGHTSDVKQITLTPGTSNIIVTTSSSQGLFELLQFDIGTGYKQIAIEPIPVDASVPRIINAQLPVPLAHHSGPVAATITYTVAEA